MSLNPARLEKARELGGGITQARCPACAEGGHDRTGEHLRIYPDGRFGCCVHPKDKEHRKRIFALVGHRQRGTVLLRIKTPPAVPAVQSVKASLSAFTVGTPKAESEKSVPSVPTLAAEVGSTESGTLGTPKVKPRAYARENVSTAYKYGEDFHEELKDWESGVLSVPAVPAGNQGGRVQPAEQSGARLPFLTADGVLSIPFDCPERYHWWKGGQTITATRNEVTERMSYAGEF